jgi:hypothetical protein
MSKLLSLDVLIRNAPQQITMVWVIDATTGKPKATWVAEPRLPKPLAPLAC